MNIHEALQLQEVVDPVLFATEAEPRRRLLRLTASAAALALAGGAYLSAFAPESAKAAVEDPNPTLGVMTLNVLGSNHVGAGHWVGGSVLDRAKRGAKIIKANADVVGTQELQDDQFDMYSDLLPGYESEPANHASDNTIFYKTSRFKRLGGGIKYYPYYGDRFNYQTKSGQMTGEGVWVRLQDKKTGKIWSFLNEHAVAWNEDPGSDQWGGQKRNYTALGAVDWAENIHNRYPGDREVILGDYNSTNNRRPKAQPPLTPKPKDVVVSRNELPYCEITKEFMQDTLDMIRGLSGHCPDESHSYRRDSTVDWIFASPSVEAVNSRLITGYLMKHTSDHKALLADLRAK